MKSGLISLLTWWVLLCGVVVNGEVKGRVPGEEFNRALLRIWFGERPVDDSLKRAMLGA